MTVYQSSIESGRIISISEFGTRMKTNLFLRKYLPDARKTKKMQDFIRHKQMLCEEHLLKIFLVVLWMNTKFGKASHHSKEKIGPTTIQSALSKNSPIKTRCSQKEEYSIYSIKTQFWNTFSWEKNHHDATRKWSRTSRKSPWSDKTVENKN